VHGAAEMFVKSMTWYIDPAAPWAVPALAFKLRVAQLFEEAAPEDAPDEAGDDTEEEGDEAGEEGAEEGDAADVAVDYQGGDKAHTDQERRGKHRLSRLPR
jgi:hypothetical protein